ncbi:MaoC family dehydratase N-terminal domain-containing protein [Phyllobacterium sp. 21LDTY02-6]|uniref:MaoC family dehydratase n=1 Tax=Phyllobacterium sp. 21LDTY02-6 TaxID=2944903 RepID=UPI002022798A|nr:MaoC/PaaZ C-terminal domain-containing protein [Phyllobacterium sp. 21LDTY02-6]MCO4319164.1 MaoC family dehydratase N-terminal domain-containing protein [Phyllobacterium sp. 21LDTY02-6]
MPGWQTIERYFEDYTIGERDIERRRTVDQADTTMFAGLTLDFHPAHIDESFAAPRYGGRLVHGMLTFSIVTGLCVEYNMKAISYGYEKVRFPAPVRAGDTIVAWSEVMELTPHRKPEIGLVTKKYTGQNQDGVTVFSCLHILAIDRKAST